MTRPPGLAKLLGMAVIAVHRETGKRYVLLGAGFGRVRGDHGLDQTSQLLALCDGEGRVHWIPARDIAIVSVDGEPPASLLRDATYR
ncbi:MAG: hypothetical protein ACFCGT_00415 [Sandaracinaceae bacterium]